MKKLLLIRHGKSSWKDSEIDDHERPLNNRGERDRITMARYLAEQDTGVEVLYSSTAIRALDLAQTISDFTGINLVPDLTFYTFDVDQLMQIIQSLPDEASRVAVVGHNPAITHTTNLITGAELSNVPTSGIATIEIDVDCWADIESGLGELVDLIVPKQLHA